MREITIDSIKAQLKNKSISELEALSSFIEQLIEEKKEQAKEVSFDTFFLEVIDLLGDSGHTTMQKAIDEWYECNQGRTVNLSQKDEYVMARQAVLWAYDYARNPDDAEEFYASDYERDLVEKWESKYK